jgi:hypothetical protein
MRRSSSCSPAAVTAAALRAVARAELPGENGGGDVIAPSGAVTNQILLSVMTASNPPARRERGAVFQVMTGPHAEGRS